MIRPAEASDIPAIHRLIGDLAEYERAPHEVKATEQDLCDALLAEQPALFAHVAEEDGQIVGYALWFLNYSTWLGRHGIYLEDLYVMPDQRGRGHGRALLAELARLCVERGYRGYWEELVPRMRPGGMILVDNTLLHGRIFEASPDPDALAIREFNEHVLTDDRVEVVMLPVGDGLTLARAKQRTAA